VGKVAAPMILFVIAAIVLALLLAAVSYRIRILSRGGAVVTFLVACGAFLAFGPAGFAYITAVLYASSLATKYRYQVKFVRKVAEGKQGARNVWKVTGAAGAGGLIAWIVIAGVVEKQSGMVGFVAAIAFVNSDTWACELGILSPKKPRLILPPWSEVNPGLSGAISLVGETASVAGALFSVTLAYALGLLGANAGATWIGSVTAVTVSEHLDSLLGASIQESYYCPRCAEATDRRLHDCGNETNLVRGSRLITNSGVNLISASVSAILAVSLVKMLTGL
jgi:uncharacterized protein (TIGR00297 family)